MRRNLDDLLIESGGESLSANARVRDQVSALVAKSEGAAVSRRPRWVRNAIIAVAAAVLVDVGLTAGAVGVGNTFTPDVVIQVSYITDQERQVDCSIYIEGGSILDPGSTVIGDYLKHQDWTGIGQKMYQRAVQLSDALALSEPGTLSEAERDQWAWYMAEDQLTVRSVPNDMLAEGEHAASGSSCPGELH